MRLPIFLFLLFTLNIFGQPIWQPLKSITGNQNNQRFDDVFFINDNLGWAANGYYAAVYKTTDGGQTWSEQLNETNISGDYYFRNIEFLNENIGFLGTLNGVLFQTDDGGSTWTTVTNISPNPSAICGLDAVGSSTVYGCGAYFTPAHIIKSDDSGNTWQYIDMSDYANALVEIFFLSENIGFVSGRSDSGATLLKTTDGGTTWSEIFNSNVPGEYVWKIQVLEKNPDVIFGSITSVAPNHGKLVKSTNGGQSWDIYNAPETDIQAVGFISENHGWMGGHNTGFYETLDGGQTWTNLNTGSNLNRIFVIGPSLAYASGTSIYKFTEETLSSGTFEESNRTALKVTLKSNPVQSHLVFDIEFQSNDNLLIELYDINGKFIEQLAKSSVGGQTIKNYSFSVEHLPSGSYFVNLHNNTGRQSLKFIKI